MRKPIRLLEAGLGKALSEIRPCRNNHSGMAKERGYSYCPHCGEKLDIQAVCEFCNKDFYSAKAYHAHVIYASRFHRTPPCPRCGSATRYVKNSHPPDHVVLLHCDRCQSAVSMLAGRETVMGNVTEKLAKKKYEEWVNRRANRKESPDPIEEGLVRLNKITDSAREW